MATIRLAKTRREAFNRARIQYDNVGSLRIKTKSVDSKLKDYVVVAKKGKRLRYVPPNKRI